jgi:hypothetical protein
MFLNEKMVTTRKEHVCWGCGLCYPKKTLMTVSTSEDLGRIISSYWCLRCEAFIKTLSSEELQDLSEGIDYKGLLNFPSYKNFGGATHVH